MRLSELLSKAPDAEPLQVESFLGDRRLGWGKHRKISVGKVFHNFRCRNCDDQRTFQSGEELYCLGLGDRSVSVDATLKCAACDASVELWFLLASDGPIFERAPTIRIERYTENLRDRADRVGPASGPFADLVSRAHVAYEAGLGAGSMIYLRKVFEMITFEVAGIANISVGTQTGRRPFRQVLEEVDERRNIIPYQFSSNGYKLFGELSDVIHGDSSEEKALRKFKPCLQLVLGVIEEVNRDNVFANAIDELGWSSDDIRKMTAGGVSA